MRAPWPLRLRETPAPVRARWAAGVAALAGLAGAGAFPQLGIWPLMPISVAGLSWAVDGRRARTGAWLGMLYGLGFFVPLLHWTGIYVGAVPWLILAVAEAVFMAGLGAVLTLVQRLPAMPVWVGCAWVLEEALRDRIPFGGFPWGRLAFSQTGSPLRWFVELGGAPLLTFAVAVTGAALAAGALAVRSIGSIRSLRTRLPARALIRAATVVVLVPLLGYLWSVVAINPSSSHTLRVALIQGSVPPRGLEFETRARQVLHNHIAETMVLARQIQAGTVPRPDLVVWPENASDVDPLTDKSAGAAISRAVKAVGAPTLVGAILHAPDNKRRNAGIMWSPTSGPGQIYVKRHPVPFAEYIPLRGIAEAISSAARLVKQDMVAGTGNGLLTGGPVPIGDVICFEVAYDDLVQSSVAAGAQLVVVQTNNATFGYTSETFQQLAISKLRAIETGRTVLQVSTTGASAIVSPDGTTIAEADKLYRPAILQADIALETAETPAVWLGAAPEWFLTGLAVLAAAASVLAARRAKATPVAPASVPDEMVGT
jgi:apolipoprotein N-acyltransferase